MFLSTFTLLWQLIVIFASCFGVGLALRFFVPKRLALPNKALFSLMGGLSLVVLIPQNLVYLGVPVRISAWLILAAAFFQVWLFRRNLVAWIGSFYSNADIRALAAITILTVAFHGIVPLQQGLDGYYGKANPDQLNYVGLAEFLKEEPYSTSQQDVGLRPWLARVIGFQDNPDKISTSHGHAQELIGLKNERIGQSIVTAEISVWSGTDGKGGYAATVIFFLTLLGICLYIFLREAGIDRFMAGSGALLATLLPAVTRLSLNGFLSHVSILFVFPFFASLLRQRGLSARGFTLFFSLTLAYVVSAYPEIAPIALCTFFLGVFLIRRDNFRAKRLMLMSTILLIALVNPFYLRNLVEFLGKQYYVAVNADMEQMVPNVLTLRGWSELIFGVVTSPSLALVFDYCAILLGALFLIGITYLSRRDKVIFVAILLPVVLAIIYLAVRTSASHYPIAKIALSVLPFLIVVVFVALSGIAARNEKRGLGVITKFLCAMLVAVAVSGSVRYYSQVLNNEGLLRYVREPRFLNVCRGLEQVKNKRVLVFETYPLLTLWLCYHARRNDVYFDGRFNSDSAFQLPFPFMKVPDLQNVDFVATRDRIIDLRDPSVSCLTFVGETPGQDLTDSHVRYGLGPPVGLRFLAFRPISANLTMQLALGPDAKTFPVKFLLADEQGRVSQGEIWGGNPDVRRLNLPRGLSKLLLSVKAKDSDPKTEPSFPILAELVGLEISDIR